MSIRPANHHRDQSAGDSAGQPLIRLFDRHRVLAGLANKHREAGRWLAEWDRSIDALVMACNGSAPASAALEEHLGRLTDAPDWQELVSALRDSGRERGADMLAGLDAVDALIVRRALAALSGQDSIVSLLWPALPLSWLLGGVIGAVRGDARLGGGRS